MRNMEILENMEKVGIFLPGNIERNPYFLRGSLFTRILGLFRRIVLNGLALPNAASQDAGIRYTNSRSNIVYTREQISDLLINRVKLRMSLSEARRKEVGGRWRGEPKPGDCEIVGTAEYLDGD